ncbi:MAG: hypothetical protein IKC84_03600 [Helicobacteraceae bacterium]|nr:hypothetical protein [Helicobacteraceae bacterium]
MKYLIKDTLRPIYHYATNKYHTRDIYAIFDKLGGGQKDIKKREISNLWIWYLIFPII